MRDGLLAALEIPGVEESDPYALARTSSAALFAAYAANFKLMTVIENQALVDAEVDAIGRRSRKGRGMFAQFARHVPWDSEAFERMVDDLTAMYLRLLGIGRWCRTLSASGCCVCAARMPSRR